jgi:hypothetical protein
MCIKLFEFKCHIFFAATNCMARCSVTYVDNPTKIVNSKLLSIYLARLQRLRPSCRLLLTKGVNEPSRKEKWAI